MRYIVSMWLDPVARPGEVREPEGPYYCVGRVDCTQDIDKASRYDIGEAYSVVGVWALNCKPYRIIIERVGD